MSENVKKSTVWAVERIGLPAVFCLILWWGFRADAKSQRDDVLSQLRTISAAVQSSEKNYVRTVEQIASLREVDIKRDSQMESVTGDVEDNEDAILAMSRDRFTKDDGAELRQEVRENRIKLQLTNQQYAQLAVSIEKNRRGIEKIYYALTDHAAKKAIR